MTPQRIAAFSDGARGGNPAGVVIEDDLPAPESMQALAREIGYSETVFAAPARDGWRVRYFSPETEVAFCGHATIALGAALGQRLGAGVYPLELANGEISVTAAQDQAGWSAELASPGTWSAPLDGGLTSALSGLFGFDETALDPRLPPTLGFAGVRHAIIALRDRAALAAMRYDFEVGRALMAAHELTTISLLHIEAGDLFNARNAFAIGGVVEDPATGAAAAALGGALTDLGWPAVKGGGRFSIRQGEDMGAPSLLNVAVTGRPGDSVRVGGTVRAI